MVMLHCVFASSGEKTTTTTTTKKKKSKKKVIKEPDAKCIYLFIRSVPLQGGGLGGKKSKIKNKKNKAKIKKVMEVKPDQTFTLTEFLLVFTSKLRVAG